VISLLFDRAPGRLEAARELIGDLQTTSLLGYVRGKTAIRDAVASRLHCSQLRSEELVDTLSIQGFAHFVGDPADASPGYWVLTSSTR
jgi:hypothetical protein